MRVLVLANFGMGLYNFRRELLERLISQEHEVFVSLPADDYVPKLQQLGCKFVEVQLDRRGTNPLKDIRLLISYLKIINDIKPNIVLTYTIKPNIYGGIACTLSGIPYISNITGLGTSIENQGLIQKITLMLYRLGLKRASCVFFQNTSNRKFFKERRIVSNRTKLIPGSGVNLDFHKYEQYPPDDDKIRFLFVGRIMKAKGIEELLEAATLIKANCPQVNFDLVGGKEENYTAKISELERRGIISYYGQQADVRPFIIRSHAIILPSHHEGLSNVLLESASTGRPVLASKIPGCEETYDDEVTGFGFEAQNVSSLAKAILQFVNLPYEQKKRMGYAGRRKMEREFDRNAVTDAYLEEIILTLGEEKCNEFIHKVS